MGTTTAVYAYGPPQPLISTTIITIKKKRHLLSSRVSPSSISTSTSTTTSYSYYHHHSTTFPSRSSVSRNLKISQRRRSCAPKGASWETSIGGVDMEDKEDDEACELVRGSDIVVGENEVTVHAYLLEAVKNNNGAGVILLPDVFGFEDSCTRDFAYRVACSGYNVLIPDLFRGNPWKKDQDHSKFQLWLASHPPDRVAKDIATSTEWMIEEFAVAGMPKRLGLLGFSFGGFHVLQALASDDKTHFGTGVCFYGTNLDVSLASRIRVPILFISGDNDPLCPISIQREMEKNIKGSKLVLYHDRGHGFTHRPQSQEEDEDAEDSFMIARSWLHDFLVVNKERDQ